MTRRSVPPLHSRALIATRRFDIITISSITNKPCILLAQTISTMLKPHSPSIHSSAINATRRSCPSPYWIDTWTRDIPKAHGAITLVINAMTYFPRVGTEAHTSRNSMREPNRQKRLAVFVGKPSPPKWRWSGTSKTFILNTRPRNIPAHDVPVDLIGSGV